MCVLGAGGGGSELGGGGVDRQGRDRVRHDTYYRVIGVRCSLPSALGFLLYR